MKHGGFGARMRVTLIVTAVACAFPAAAIAAPNDTKLISRANGASGAKQNGSFVGDPAISADGRYVAFSTTAGNLVVPNPSIEAVYLRDTQLNTIALVSVALSGNPNGPSSNPTVSEDGRYVAFESDATNLHGDDTDSDTDVFVRDMQMNTTTLVSRATGAAGAASNGDSFKPSISADGLRVAFESAASNLGADADAPRDVFLRDTQANTTTLVSCAGAACDPVNGASLNAAISGDGRHVAFDSTSSQLHPDDLDTSDDVFVRDTLAGTTTLVDRADGVNGAKGTSSLGPAISADGRFIAFSSQFPIDPADSIPGTGDVYVRDVQAADTTLVSRADGPSGAVGNSISGFASISANGRFIAFESLATNFGDDALALDPADRDVWLRDTQANDTILLSRESGANGVPGNLPSNRPAISGDGRITAFDTEANNFAGLDDNDLITDVYTREADVDLVAPTAQITSAPGARTADNTPTVIYTTNPIAPDLAGFECSIDGAAFAACAGTSFTTPQLSDGAHNVRVRAFDNAANRGNPVTAAFTVDTTGPTTQIQSGPPATIATQTATVTFSSPDADAAGFQCALDGAAFSACTSPFTTPALADGAHTVDVRAVDDLGNVGPSQLTAFTVQPPGSDPTPPPGNPVDTKAPETQLLGKASIKTTKRQVSISFEADEAATFGCRVDGKPFASCTSPFKTPKLKPGKHTVDVRATDQAGNVDQTPARAKVKVKRKKRRR